MGWVLAVSHRICLWYDVHRVQDRLQNLIPTMLQGKKAAPKIRCSAAQCRALVPCANALAMELLSMTDPVEQAARVGMHHLHECYKALSDDFVNASDHLRTHSTAFALQYVARPTSTWQYVTFVAIYTSTYQYITRRNTTVQYVSIHGNT